MGFSREVRGELATTAEFLEAILNLEEEQGEYLKSLDLPSGEVRITLIASDGTVLYDNVMPNEEELDNHGKRREIEDAIRNGFGEDKRHSETVEQETYYYATLLSNGNILRTAKTTSSIYGVFISVLPQNLMIVAIVLLVGFMVARRLARKILAPVNQFGLDQEGKIYDELSPFVKTIKKQKKQIGEAIDEVTKKSVVLDAIIKNMNEGMILVNKEGTVLSANNSALSILGTQTLPIGKNILETTRNIAILENMKTALTGDNHNITMEIEGRTYHIFFSAVDNGVLILFLDITEKAKAEKMRREFTANVSHELRTPLTTISGYTELLSNGMVQTSDIANVAKKMKGESDRLLALIEDTMRLSELEEADKQKRFETFDLTTLIADVADNLRLKADKHAITIHVPEEKYELIANRSMIYELIYNLLDNAIKYNRPNGSVTVTIKKVGSQTRIAVKDTGIGIARKYQERIFERFYRVDKSRSQEIDGTGLGLSIVKHIVAYHDGHVEVESEEGEGTMIIVFIAE